MSNMQTGPGKTNEAASPDKIWNIMFIGIFFVNMALNFGQYMSNSLLSLYAKSMGAPAEQIGMLMSMFAITALIFRFVAGPAINAYNRKVIVAIAMGCMASAYFGFSFAPAIAGALGVQIISVLKCFRLLQGIGSAFAGSCCLTIVSDMLPKNKFSSGMGIFACAQVIAQAIGPTVGVLLKDRLGYTITYFIFGCIMVCAIIASTMLRLAPNVRTPFNLKLKNMIAKEAVLPAVITFLIALGFTTINSFLLVYAEERGISGASLFFTVYALTMLVTRPMIGKLTDKYGFVKVGIPSVLATACSLVLIGIATNLPMLLFAAFVNAFGYGAVMPALQSLSMRAVSPERRGSASSTNYIGQDTATLIGSTVAGYVASMAGYTPLMWVTMAVPVLLAVLFIILFRKYIYKVEKNFKSRN